MKKIFKPFIALVVLGTVFSCSELKDDDHYGNAETQISNNELKIVDVTSEEYINGRSDLSNMNELFKSQGIYDELKKKGQLSTMLVVTNDHFKTPEDKTDFVTRSHVSDISISPANLEDGTRLMMWHGKYVNVSIDSLGKNGVIVDHILFNNGAVKEVVKTTTGYVYVISDMIETPTSLYDFINDLDDDYSIFREMVLASGGREFDRNNSKAIGINDQGNTVYDSVFIYRNTFFEAVNFDMNSESLTATMLLPSNKVIEDALNDAHQRLQNWDMERSDSIMKDWILKSAFYNKRYTASQIQTADLQDLKSVFNTQWRTNVQQVNTAEPIELSNGIVYKITKLHLPNNLLMYRLKDYFYYYENCTDEQKATYFKAVNLNFKECNTEVTAWSPLPGVWPYHENRIVRFDKPSEIADADGFQLDFTPVKLNDDGTVRPYLFPPGAYRFAMGSVQNQNLDIMVIILINGQEITRTRTIRWSTSTEFHYDRGTTLSNTHPEGYDATYVREVGGNSKAANYDTDGGQMMEELVIPDVNGDGSPVQITMRINCNNWEGKTNVKFHHWCLRPTTNNY
ncbi:MAG: hypothetical protein II806_05145 [Bacteroidaceae bacterium]|nr:hypothetical protein [Bacteroidaceae bacterium]